jgi:hypothetical protein
MFGFIERHTTFLTEMTPIYLYYVNTIATSSAEQNTTFAQVIITTWYYNYNYNYNLAFTTRMMKAFLLIATFLPTIVAFQGLAAKSSSRCPTALAMSDDDFMRWARASRSAQDGDNVVELVRPLGLILKEDEQRNVYVETLAPKGNAARSGKVRESSSVGEL